jgi:uracil-DNA glycosylase family 4
MDMDMNEDRAWLVEQIRERLRFYGSLTPLGFDVPEQGGISEPERKPPRPVVRRASLPAETLEKIRQDLGECTRCRLHSGRRTIVFGVGNPNADLMFIGEGPGDDEDVQGEPFVGAAGKLLDKIIQAIDMTREEVYIANVVKCHPPENRDPEPDEVEPCIPFLERQIESVGPRVICTLGLVAAQAVLSTDKSLRMLRGQTFHVGDAILVPTFHPAYLLRNPGKKRETWEDMKLIRRLLALQD